jgi:hypothetical protein
MLSALADRMLRDHVHLWITFVFVSNTCVSLDITKTSPEDRATFAVHDLRSCLLQPIARMSLFSGHFKRLHVLTLTPTPINYLYKNIKMLLYIDQYRRMSVCD